MDGFKKRRAEKFAQVRGPEFARFGVKGPIETLRAIRELLLHLALRVGVPVDAVKKIRNEFLLSWWGRITGIDGRRRLPGKSTPFNWVHGGWAGTQRANNQRDVMDRFWYTSAGVRPFPLGHLFAFENAQPGSYFHNLYAGFL